MNRTLSTRLTRLLGAAALALGLAAGNASATDVVIPGTIGTTPIAIAMPHPSVSSFIDNIQFTLGALGTFGSSATPVNLAIGSLNVLELTFDSGAIYSGVIGTVGPALGFFANSSGVLSFTGSLTPGGTYFAKLSGTTSGFSGGGYAFAIAAIPEPGQWLMLLAGVALLGVMVRRRA